MIKQVAAVCTCVLALLSSVDANATIPELGGTVTADFNAGADKLLLLEFTDGTDQDIRAGNGLIFAITGGVMLFDPGPHRVELLASAGLKFSTMQPTENADLTFMRTPLELLAFYRLEPAYFRVGGGLVYSPSNSLTGSGALEDLDVTFDPATGWITQIDFVSGGFNLGLRYTHLTYAEEETGTEFAAHTIGVGLGYCYHFID